MNNMLTVVITSSFIPSHPSIKLIKETIESLSLLNPPSNTKIILAHDYHNHNKYRQYFQELNKYIDKHENIFITLCKKHSHLVGNIRNALREVTSKYILVIQHDLPFIRNCEILKIIQDIEEASHIKYVRFNKRQNIKVVSDAINNLFGLQDKQKNYTYTRTPAWSDNNHLCLTTYYKDIVMKECPDGCAMEHKLQGKIKNETIHEKYGTYLFGEINHPQMIKHTDGRFTM